MAGKLGEEVGGGEFPCARTVEWLGAPSHRHGGPDHICMCGRMVEGDSHICRVVLEGRVGCLKQWSGGVTIHICCAAGRGWPQKTLGLHYCYPPIVWPALGVAPWPLSWTALLEL